MFTNTAACLQQSGKARHRPPDEGDNDSLREFERRHRVPEEDVLNNQPLSHPVSPE
jgi:hypothetical protein